MTFRILSSRQESHPSDCQKLAFAAHDLNEVSQILVGVFVILSICLSLPPSPPPFLPPLPSLSPSGHFIIVFYYIACIMLSSEMSLIVEGFITIILLWLQLTLCTHWKRDSVFESWWQCFMQKSPAPLTSLSNLPTASHPNASPRNISEENLKLPLQHTPYTNIAF